MTSDPHPFKEFFKKAPRKKPAQSSGSFHLHFYDRVVHPLQSLAGLGKSGIVKGKKERVDLIPLSLFSRGCKVNLKGPRDHGQKQLCRLPEGL